VFKRPIIYLDLYTSAEDYASLLDLIEGYTSRCEPITRILKDWTLPKGFYDTLIVDYVHLLDLKQPLSTLYKVYAQVIVINVPDDPSVLENLYESGIQLWVKDSASKYDMKILFDQSLNTKLLQDENKALYRIIDNAQNSIVITDKKGNIEFANPYFEKTTGYTTEEFISKSPNVIKSGFHEAPFYKDLWEAISTGKVWEGIFVNKDKYDNRFYEESTITPLRNAHGEIMNFVKIGKNITRERLLLDELSKEVKLAKTAIQGLFPDAYTDDFVDFDYSLLHYNELGGDFIFFDKNNLGKYHFVLIDVMGHGLSSSMIAITMSQIFKDYIKFKTLEESVDAVNDHLCTLNAEDPERSKYMTGIFMEVDPSQDSLKLINAGHMDAILLEKSGASDPKPSNNLIMGVMPQKHTAYTLKLSTYTRFLCFTDGLYESSNLEYEDALTQIQTAFEERATDRFFSVLYQNFNIDKTLKDDVTVCQMVFKDFPASLSKS
jgi:PAS domain S-box-containing protein